jgi:glycosyltransferase involved in cell wall biosynthesis
MRICLYTETALPMLGGQELVVDALARQFLTRGHEAVVLAPPPRSPLRADDGTLPYRVVRHPRFISTRRFLPLYRRFLTRLHRSFPFEVLHCHSAYPTGYLGVLAQKECGFPVIITSHGGDINEGNQVLYKPGVRERFVVALHGADALVAISSFTRDGFARLAPGCEVHDIPNGVDTAAFAAPAPRPAALPPEIQSKAFLLFLGRLSIRKGVDVLLDALATVPAAARPLVVLAGSGAERAALDARCMRLGVVEATRFLGQVTGPAKTWLLQHAIATVIPSRDWEAFPLVILESFAAGTPVIAPRIPGLRELVTPGRTGWLVEPEAPAELSQALREAIADPARAARMGEAARSDAQAFDWSVVAGRYLALYEKTIARVRNTPLKRPPA